MTGQARRLERRYRQLLRCYPSTWRRRHEDAMLAVLLDQAEAEGRTSVTLATAVDLVGHGAEERLESLLRWLPGGVRTQVASAALVAGAGLALIMLVGEMIGTHFRPPAGEVVGGNPIFLSGPFLTIGVGLYLALMSAALLVVRGHGGVARVLLLVAVAYAAWMGWPSGSAGYPTPRLLVLVLLAGLGLLAALATIRTSRRAVHGFVGHGAGLVGALALGLLATRPVLGWSVGTMATSGNVALAALATVLPFLTGIAVVGAALRSGRHPGWAAAIAITAVPVVIFCSAVGQVVNPARADNRAWIPVCYAMAVVVVALIHRRRRAASRRTHVGDQGNL